jgi:hypothetical protein
MKLITTPRDRLGLESESRSQSTHVVDIHVEGAAFGLILQTARYGTSSDAIEAADFVVDRMTTSLKRLAES